MKPHSAIVFLFFILLVGSTSCKRKEEVKVKWFYYDETECADPWSMYKKNGKEDDKINGTVKEEFSKKHVKITTIAILSDRTREVNCVDCRCKTGRRIMTSVDEKDSVAMIQAGFYE
jgi:hypothetical protein